MPADYALVGYSMHFCCGQVTVQNGRVLSLGVWDTAGAERFQSISRMYYRGSKAAIVCFTPISQQSFTKALFWVCLATCCLALSLCLCMLPKLPFQILRCSSCECKNHFELITLSYLVPCLDQLVVGVSNPFLSL